MTNDINLPNIYILGNGEEPMKIKKMTIDNICGIKHLDLNFNDGLNLICGENGVGKTTILECISHAFIFKSTNKLKKNANAQQGTCKLIFQKTDSDSLQETFYVLNHFNPTGEADFINQLSDQSQNVLLFNSQRSFEYQNLSSISKDPDKRTSVTASDAYSGISASDIKNWFIQRYMWSAHKNVLEPEQRHNFNVGRNSFSALDSAISFSRVKADTNDIMVNTKQGEVYFEYLSSGYKSCIYILLGIIKEIEFRFKDPYIKVQDFNGIILIDEIDVHLHPQWQSKLVEVIKTTFSKAQIIATTHSPSVLQNARAEEIIPLYIDTEGKVDIKELSLGEYGLQGWTLEEIMKDVMGMTSTTSELYTQVINDFDKAMYDENVDMAKEKYNLLCQMLHPNNPLRQLMQIQMAGMGE